MEILRALAALCEPPGSGSARLAELLGLPSAPLDSDWSDLFLFELSPYASVYLGPDGRIGGEARDRVAGFWRALGLVPPAESDHLAILLAFYAELAEKADSAGGAERARFDHARGAFVSEHLLSWLPPYLLRLGQVAPPFYRAWGLRLGEALSWEARRVAAPAGEPLHWRAAPELADPRRDGGPAFLAGLLTPAASGLLITRSDLERAGRELGLGVRVGERRFQLEMLFGQAPREVLAWLARAAGEWSACLADPAPGGLEIGSFWVRRAAASARLLATLRDQAA